MFDQAVRDHLDVVDRDLPGFVDGLYVVGSAALGGWQDGVSDVDTVIFTSREPIDADLAALSRAAPHVDGVYLPPALARSWPHAKQAVPFVVNGSLRTGVPCGELTPVLWLVLRRHAIHVRGPAVADLDVRVDPDRRAATTWRTCANTGSRRRAGRAGVAPLVARHGRSVVGPTSIGPGSGTLSRRGAPVGCGSGGVAGTAVDGTDRRVPPRFHACRAPGARVGVVCRRL